MWTLALGNVIVNLNDCPLPIWSDVGGTVTLEQEKQLNHKNLCILIIINIIYNSNSV